MYVYSHVWLIISSVMITQIRSWADVKKSVSNLLSLILSLSRALKIETIQQLMRFVKHNDSENETK